MSLEISATAYQAEFRSFAVEEETGGLPDRPILFYGSSSIRLWSSLRHDFEGLPVVNRGFGGSTLEECVALLDRLVAPVKPRAIVLYAGDNDLDQGASPELLLSLFEQFASGVRARLGWTPIIYISGEAEPGAALELREDRGGERPHSKGHCAALEGSGLRRYFPTDARCQRRAAAGAI